LSIPALCRVFEVDGKNLVDCLQEMLVKHAETIIQLADKMTKRKPPLLTEFLLRRQRRQTDETKRGTYLFH
jgi:hypothetical protein